MCPTLEYDPPCMRSNYSKLSEDFFSHGNGKIYEYTCTFDPEINYTTTCQRNGTWSADPTEFTCPQRTRIYNCHLFLRQSQMKTLFMIYSSDMSCWNNIKQHNQSLFECWRVQIICWELLPCTEWHFDHIDDCRRHRNVLSNGPGGAKWGIFLCRVCHDYEFLLHLIDNSGNGTFMHYHLGLKRNESNGKMYWADGTEFETNCAHEESGCQLLGGPCVGIDIQATPGQRFFNYDCENSSMMSIMGYACQWPWEGMTITIVTFNYTKQNI